MRILQALTTFIFEVDIIAAFFASFVSIFEKVLFGTVRHVIWVNRLGNFLAFDTQFLRTFLNNFLALAIEINSWELNLTLAHFDFCPATGNLEPVITQSVEKLSTQFSEVKLLGDEVPDNWSHQDL